MLFRHIRFVIAEPASLGRASGRVVFRIEIEDHVPAAKFFERLFFAARRWKSEVGREIADFRFVEILQESLR